MAFGFEALGDIWFSSSKQENAGDLAGPFESDLELEDDEDLERDFDFDLVLGEESSEKDDVLNPAKDFRLRTAMSIPVASSTRAGGMR